MDITGHNRSAWDGWSRDETSEWTRPVGSGVIARARQGDWSVVLTPNKPVPQDWFGGIAGRDVLALASGGGQQVPVLAAAGARVTSFDNSGIQLEKDRQVAERDGLALETVRGDMADLSRFANASFDLVFNPVSTIFTPDLTPVWAECHRILRPEGRLMTGAMNPAFYLFDHESIDEGGPLEVRYALPFSDLDYDPDARIARGEALEFSHSLDAQIGGLIRAGFRIIGFYEDHWSDDATRLNAYMPSSFALLAERV